MSVTVFTFPMPSPPLRLSVARSKSGSNEIGSGTDLGDDAELLAISFAKRRLTKVLLLTAGRANLVNHSKIRAKPEAIRIVSDVTNWSGTMRQIEDFCQKIDNPASRAYLSGVRHQAVVIVNDVDHFVAGAGSAGLFARTCDSALVNRIVRLSKIVNDTGGELILMTVLESPTEQWKKLIESQGWNWKPFNEWQKQMVSVEEATKQPLAGRSADSAKTNAKWIHEKWEEPPAEFPHGPIKGNQRKLTAWLYPDESTDYRHLQNKAANGVIWVRLVHRYQCAVWFKFKREFEIALQRQQERPHVETKRRREKPE